MSASRSSTATSLSSSASRSWTCCSTAGPPRRAHPATRDIANPGVEFRHETITKIDPAAKRVETDGGSYDADVLVVALGADYDIDATPGFAEDGYEFYSMAGAEHCASARDVRRRRRARRRAG